MLVFMVRREHRLPRHDVPVSADCDIRAWESRGQSYMKGACVNLAVLEASRATVASARMLGRHRAMKN